jgi:nicotinate-nucleotide--dimethylbenzimidazole phosphoribosyltransferase
MEKCQLRIDNLCKPIYSLGRLEEIAVKIAGITASAKPNVLQKRILCFGSKATMSSTQQKLTAAFAQHANAKITLIELPKLSQDLLAAIKGGMLLAEKEIRQGTKIIGIATTENQRHDICGTKVKQALQKLLTTNYIELTIFKDRLLTPHTAASETPAANDIELAYMIGLILGAAHGGALIVLDNFISEIAAKIAIDLAPNVKDYILRTETPPASTLDWDIPSYLNLNMTTGGGCIAALGMKLVDASLHMLNDMKTFTDASVSVANVGPGAGRHKNIRRNKTPYDKNC